MTSPKTEYRAKITVDTGMARGRVPTPLLKQIGARPGDYLTFRLVSTGEVVMRLLR
jgi:antitoxin component of MazEF toxin-antitoxin module